MAAGEFYVHYRLISYSDCGLDHLFAIGMFPWATCFDSGHCRLFKGGNVNKEQRWRVRPTLSVTWLPLHLSDSHLIWIWLSIPCPNLPIMYPLLQQGLTAREGNLFTTTILHFTSLLRAGVTEREAARAVVKWNVHLARFNRQDMATVNSAISADWELIVYCTEADPISHCRKNTFSVFVCVHGCQRGDCQAREACSNKHVTQGKRTAVNMFDLL